jgi:hypothetical protein
MERLDRADAEPAPQEQILKDRRYLRARQQLDKELDREMGALELKASDGFFRARSGNRTGQPAP